MSKIISWKLYFNIVNFVRRSGQNIKIKNNKKRYNNFINFIVDNVGLLKNIFHSRPNKLQNK